MTQVSKPELLPKVSEQLVARCPPGRRTEDRIQRACTTIWTRMSVPAQALLSEELRDAGFNGGLNALIAFATKALGLQTSPRRGPGEWRIDVLEHARKAAIGSVPASKQASRATVSSAMQQYWETLTGPAREELADVLESSGYNHPKGVLASLIAFAVHEVERVGMLYTSEWWPGKGQSKMLGGGLPGLGKNR